MSRCDVTLVQGDHGETKRVLLNGEPVPGLLKAQTASGPRDRPTVVLTIFASSLTTEREVPSGGN